MSYEARAQPATELSRSPLWSHLLERAEAQIASARPPAERSATSAGHTVDSAAAHAHSRLLVALDCGTHGGRDLVSELIGGAADVIVDVEGLATWVDRRHSTIGLDSSISCEGTSARMRTACWPARSRTT